MKKQLSPILLAVASMLYLSACRSTEQVMKYGNITKSATSNSRMIVKNTLTETPIVADVEVEEVRVSGSYEGKNTGEEQAKELAVANALRKSDAEVLVQPTYRIEVRDYTNILVFVEGFPGKYVNFRTPTHNDSLILGLILPKKELPPTPAPIKYEPNPNGDNHFYNINLKPYLGGGNQTEGQTQPTQTETSTGVNPFATLPATKKQEVSTSINTMDIDNLKTYQLNYDFHKKKGRTNTALGVVFMLSGGAILTTALLTETDGLIIPAAILQTMGYIALPIGIAHHVRASRIKRKAEAEGYKLSFGPSLNPQTNTYMASVSLKF